MSKPPELWAFIIANTGIFLAGGVLTGLSYLAYRQNRRQASYRFATVGFGLVVLGGLVEPAYQLGIRGDYHLDGNEMLLLQSGEGAIIAMGLGLLFYAILRQDVSPTSDGSYPSDLVDEDYYGVGRQHPDD